MAPTKPLPLLHLFLLLLPQVFSLAAASSSVLITGNSTLTSPNQTFEIGFFSLDSGSSHFLGIWYASIPIRTYIWVANRLRPISSALTPATLHLAPAGRLSLRDAASAQIWATDNAVPAAACKLLDSGNLVLLSAESAVVWQSFDFPADSWLPDMHVTRRQEITCWRTPTDPAPGPYSLRLKPPGYGEFELVSSNRSGSTSASPAQYWSTGRWTADQFSAVPEMTVPYIYTFRFANPFTAEADFVYSVKPVEGALGRLLTRFAVDPSGQLRQYTWSSQAASWSMFWARPENPCTVPALCGSLGFCSAAALRPCECLSGFEPADSASWNSGDFSSGCRRNVELHSCGGGQELEEVGPVELDGGFASVFPDVERDFCEDSCTKNCSCLGVLYKPESRLCKHLFGDVLNLRNSSSGAPEQILYLKVSVDSSFSSESKKPPERRKMAILIGGGGGISCFLAFSVIATLFYLKWRRRRMRRKSRAGVKTEEDVEEAALAAVTTNLQVFSYKELSAATKGFSAKLGHGGFGVVYRGELPDSSLVAVKRLGRPGGGDREFRAEVRTIGSIQHVNLVRLRGFCSEDPHRLLVYEYMSNGPLSAYLGTGHHRRFNNKFSPGNVLSWLVRFRIALGTARGIAYLHEECRDCIIHCDIKPENILLDGDYAPKVSDFGLAKLVGRDFSRVLTTMRGTWGYVAPEWISGVAITAKADVYSYGMTLLEIIGGRRNVEAPPPSLHCGGGDGGDEGAEEKEKWFFPPWAARKIVEGDVAAVVDPRLSEYVAAEVERAAMVAVWCIQDQEAARPTMGSVVKMLEGTVEVVSPPQPQLLQALVSGESFPREGIVSGGASPSSSASAASADMIAAVDTPPGQSK